MSKKGVCRTALATPGLSITENKEYTESLSSIEYNTKQFKKKTKINTNNEIQNTKVKKGFIKQYKNTHTICKIKPTDQITTDNTKYGKYKM